MVGSIACGAFVGIDDAGFCDAGAVEVATGDEVILAEVVGAAL